MEPESIGEFGSEEGNDAIEEFLSSFCKDGVTRIRDFEELSVWYQVRRLPTVFNGDDRITHATENECGDFETGQLAPEIPTLEQMIRLFSGAGQIFFGKAI